MGDLVVTRNDPAEIPLGIQLYERAYADGMSFSAMLEKLDPSAQYRGDQVLGETDAFQRQLMLAGIRAHSDPVAGIWASKVEDFYSSRREGAVSLLPEFIARTWRRADYSGVRVKRLGAGGAGGAHTA